MGVLLHALVNGVDAHVAGLALGLGRLSQGDGHGARLRLRPDGAPGTVGRAAAQVVEVAVRDRRQALEAGVPEHLELAPEDLARGQSRYLAAGLVDVRQQADVRRREPAPVVAVAVVSDLPRRGPLPPTLGLLGARGHAPPRGSAARQPLVGPVQAAVGEALEGVPDEAVRLAPPPGA